MVSILRGHSFMVVVLAVAVSGVVNDMRVARDSLVIADYSQLSHN
jgi:hypothetical protein